MNVIRSQILSMIISAKNRHRTADFWQVIVKVPMFVNNTAQLDKPAIIICNQPHVKELTVFLANMVT